MAHLDPLSLEAQNLDYYPTSDLLDGRRAPPHLILLFAFLVQVAAKCCPLCALSG